MITYPYITGLLSFLGLLLATVYVWRVSRSYRKFHDERAAVSLAKAIGLWVMGMGLLISALGSLLVELQVVPVHSDLARVGLSISRGAFLGLLLTLVLADVRPGDRAE